MAKWTDNPWDRQKGETEKAFEAFAIYRDMGAERTIAAVGRQLAKSRDLIDRWRAKYNWKERVQLYDKYIDKQARQEVEKNRKDMIKRHIGIAKTLQGKALNALKNQDLDDMSIKDIREVLKMATELERITQSMADLDSNMREQESKTSFSDMITSAYEKRKNGGDDDDE